MFITEDEKRMAVDLAMKIDIGEVPISLVIETFDRCPMSAAVIMDFWLNFNDMTKSVAEQVGYEKCRKHLENCYEKGNKKWTNKNLKVIVNGLKLIYFGVKECLIGAGLTQKKNGKTIQD